MDNTRPGSQQVEAKAAGAGLKRDSLNLPRLAFIGLAYFSLAPVIYLNMGFMESDSGGPVMPFLFILITITVLPTAISYAMMNNRRPSAGSGYTWLWESTYPGVGLWLGWMMITTYVVVSALYPPAFGTFFNALLSYFHLTANTWTGVGGGIFAILVVGYLNHNNIKVSSLVIGILMVIEATFIAAVAIIIVVKGGHLGHFSAAPFNPGAATLGFSGLSLAAIFAFLSIAGVDAVAPVAEESKTPRRLIPLATILITLMAGLFWTLVSYGFAISVPVGTVEHYVAAGQITPVLPITRSYIGGWAVLVPITGFTAALASFGAALYAASRITYALSREGFLNRHFAGLHPRFHTPWRAEAATLLVSLIFLIAVSFWQGGPANAYAYLGEIFVFFVLILYMFVNLANLVYHARFQRASFNWFLNGFIPVAGIGIDGYILYKGFFVTELALPFKNGSSIVWFSVAWALIGIIWALLWYSRRQLSAISLATEV